MLHNIDINKMNTLMEKNQDVKQIIMQLLENHRTVVGTIAHEIRNPLTLISSSLQVMEIQHPEINEIPHWKQTVDNVTFMINLLQQLSSFNNSDALHYSVFSMERLLKNIAVSFAISLDNTDSDIEFTSSIPSNLGDVTGDKIKLEEVLLNLLRNAREASEDSGQINLCAFRNQNTLTIQCKDTGYGIPEDKMKTIFTPFVTYKSNGTGLGLPLSKRIVEAHGGTLTVSSEPGKETVFTIQLPV